MCMIGKVSLWFAAIDIMAFSAPNGGVPAYKSGRSSLLNSLAHIRDLTCIGSPSNAVFVSTHFVSTGVIPYFSTASFSSTYSHTPMSRKYFSFDSRALRAACQGSSLQVISSKHVTSCSCSSSTSASIACFSRLRFARPFTIDLQSLSSLWLHISSSLLQFSKFSNFSTF